MDQKYQSLINDAVENLFSSIAPRVSDLDMERIRAAYLLASDAHSHQRRKSGEPYILHPIAVATIAAKELELGPNLVIAALLHDVVEDSSYTIKDIRESFGEDVAFLVGVVTKQKSEKYEHSKQVDNFRQMLASVKYDVRALLIKLSDRMHNMRTLSSMRADKQMKIAGETDYFYAPLANRLGLYHVKRELENLSFQYRCPKEFTQLSDKVAQYRQNNESQIDALAHKMCMGLLEKYGIHVRHEIRYRTPYSIWRKMQDSGIDFNHVDIKHYIRIIYDPEHLFEDESKNHLNEKDASLQIYSALTDMFKERPGSVTNFIDSPKENGYQSFHVMLLNGQGRWEEVHISSERMVKKSRLGCSAEQTEEKGNAWLMKFKSILQDMAHHGQDIEFMEGVTSTFYNEDISVFTPKGHAVILPFGATALDFAFEIHSDIGRHAQYARINGTLQSVKTVLQRGDCVEIGTNENVEPSLDWLDCVCSYRAKRQLRTYFSHKKKLEYKRCSRCHPLPGDEVIGFREEDGTMSIHKRNCPTAIRQASQMGDSIVDVDFVENEEFMYPVRVQIRGVGRYHMLLDLTDCITGRGLTITRLNIETKDHIATCEIDYMVHSSAELQSTIDSMSKVRGIDEVNHVDIE